MIVTLTVNPSVDRTMEIDRPIVRGDVFRAVAVGDEAGGKGVNVARAISFAGEAAVAVLPADDEDLLLRGLNDAGVQAVNVPVGRPSRVNITVAEPDGMTTKFNDPGHPVPPDVLRELSDRLLKRSVEGGWIVLSGSLPPETPLDWYATAIAKLKAAGRRVALDTSEQPLVRALAGPTLPDLVKPNAHELASVTGDDPHLLESEPETAAKSALTLVDRGVGAVLLTLGAGGAVLVTATGSWRARSPEVAVRSTVGAGDASLAGYLLADQQGARPPDRLARAVAYGAAAASLPGTMMPRAPLPDVAGVAVSPLDTDSTPNRSAP